MNFKDKLIKKLVDVGKKHRILVYPMLILVAIISAISHTIYWGKGNGRKLVASVAIVALLITQSLFLTSSADVGDTSPTAGIDQDGGDSVDASVDDGSGNVDDGITEGDSTEAGSTDEGSTEEGSSDDGSTENGTSEEDGIVDDTLLGSTPEGSDSEDGIVDDGSLLGDGESGDSGDTEVTDGVKYYIVYTVNGEQHSDFVGGSAIAEGVASDWYDSAKAKAGWSYGTYSGINVTGPYIDEACTTAAENTTTSLASGTKDGANNVIVYFKATRVSYNVVVSSAGTTTSATDTVEYVSNDLAISDSYTVKGDADYGLVNKGYDFGGILYNDVQYTDTVPVSVTSVVPYVEATAKWTPQTFKVKCYFNADAMDGKVTLADAGTTYMEIDCTYDKDIELPGASAVAGYATSKGYYFSGWRLGDNVYTGINGALLAEFAEGSNNVKEYGKDLKAEWVYREVTPSLADNGSTGKTSISGLTITGEYGDTVNVNVLTNYNHEGDGSTSDKNFSYAIGDGSALSSLGLNISTTTDPGTGAVIGFNINGTLNNINTDGADVTITITDENKISTAAKDSFTVKVIANKKQVEVVPSSINIGGKAVSKAYDGDPYITVTGRCDVADKIGTDEVYATFNEEAEADDANAGTGKALTIKNVKLEGAKKDFYELTSGGAVVADGGNVTVPGVATITQGAITLGIKLADDTESDSILFGQASPKYTVYVVDTSNLADSDKTLYEGYTTNEQRENFIKNKIGFTGEYNCARTLYSDPGTYTINPVIDSSSANYLSNSPSATFTVGRDEGEGHYTILGEKVNDIYPDLQIKASNGYDKIRLVYGGDIASTATKAEVEPMFSDIVTVPDMTDGTVVIQMYDSATGAITTTATLEHVNVDRNGPVLEAFSVSPNKSLFNEFGFGTYYHAQEVDGAKVESVTITFEYSSEGSDCDKFYYSFLDESGNVRGGITHEATMTKDETTGRYLATITIGTGTYGELVVYAKNLAGNVSSKNYIKLNEKLLGMDSYYEWMVENSISASDIQVVDSDGNPAATGVWYNSLTYKTTATDNDSGLQFVTWSIDYPNGTTQTEKENAGSNLAGINSQTSYSKITGYTFAGTLASEGIPAGDYTFGATLYDNAGNSIALVSKGPYKLDCKKPVIEDNTNYSVSGYDDSIDFTFTVTEGAEESGVASVKLYLSDGTNKTELKSWGAASGYNYNIVENGTYIIEATDFAGNVSTYEKTVNNLSSEVPETPVITVDGTRGNGNWYIESKPKVNIASQKETSDGVPVTTYYNIITGSKQLEKTATSEDYTFDLSEEGQVTIEAWSVSYSGVSSEKATKTIYVDTDKPDLYITESTADDAGNLIINFKASDSVSGVNTAKVYVNDSPITVTDNDGVISGSFSSSSAESFKIVTEDIAGNVSDTITFVPMRLVVSPVMDIESDSAYLSADIYKGTYDIAESYIQYKKKSATSYDTALSNKYDTSFGKNMEYTFTGLTPDTEYDYRVYASTKTSKEVKVYEGSFKTSSPEATGVVYGSVKYDDELTNEAKTYPIYVALYSGNTYIKSAKINSADDNKYKFTDVSDGTYRVVATNGLLTKETSVTLERGGVSYPSTYVSDGGVNFVLSGLSTEVVLEDDAVALTVDGLDKIYNTALYNGNVTEADLAVVEQGGTIKITLYASYMDVSSVGDTEETIFEDRLGNDAIIERYIDIEIIKEVRDANGTLVNGTPSNITRLAEPVTLTFPLGSLSGQNIHVASLHGSGSDYSFKSWVNGSEAVLSTNYITITTDRFSVYALYRYEVRDVYYTVKWLDGDGNVMKTESVKSGESATPPTETPTKTETDKYTYTFEGWDTDYSAITGDTIVSAWFTADKKSSDTDNNTDNSNNNDNNNTDNKTNNNSPSNTSKTPSTTVNPPANSSSSSSNSDNDEISTTPVKYTYMGLSSSPKTGDATPIAVIMVVMLTSAVGMAVLRKKAKENE